MEKWLTLAALTRVPDTTEAMKFLLSPASQFSHRAAMFSVMGTQQAGILVSKSVDVYISVAYLITSHGKSRPICDSTFLSYGDGFVFMRDRWVKATNWANIFLILSRQISIYNCTVLYLIHIQNYCSNLIVFSLIWHEMK